MKSWIKKTFFVPALERKSFLFVGWLLCLTPVAVEAQFNYTATNGAISITGYTGTDVNVFIPSSIDGLPVSSIGNNAFQNALINAVTIPNSVSDIGDYAFSDCIRLTEVTIPSAVISIGGEAFRFCSSLTNITIPNSVTNIGERAFAGCTNLPEISVEANNPAYESVSGVLFDKSQTTLIQYPGGKVGSYSISNSITGIGAGAFFDCPSLTSVTIPNSVTNIGIYAFSGCTSLTTVTIPSGVNRIGESAFEDCTNLTNVTIPDSVTSIEDSAFGGCISLTNVTIPNSVTGIGYATFGGSGLINITIPNSVTMIGWNAFSGCNNLASVTIPNSVTTILSYAFAFCTNLTTVTIPNSVTNIGWNAFRACTSLTAISVETDDPAYSSADGVLFDKSQTKLIQYPSGKIGSYSIPTSVIRIGDRGFDSCTRLTSVTIPNGVTSIGLQTFSFCTKLASVTIPNGITNIGESAFDSCISLTTVTIPNSVTYIEDSAFGGCTNLTDVYFQGSAPSLGSFVFVNENATVYYLPGTTGWGSTFSRVPTAVWSLPYPLILTTNPSFGVRTKQFGFTVSWATNRNVIVEAANDLANPLWSPVATNALTGGSFYFAEPQWGKYSQRFYRLRSQ